MDNRTHVEGHLYCEENSIEMLEFDSVMLSTGVEHRTDCGADAPGVCYLVPRELMAVFEAQAQAQDLGMEWGGAPEPAPCIAPVTITKYGVRLRAGDGSNNWFDPDNVGTPVTVEGSAEFFIKDENELVDFNYDQLAGVFKAQGFIAAVRPYNLVGDGKVETAGDWTGYTCDAVKPNNPVTGDDEEIPDEPIGSLDDFDAIVSLKVKSNTLYVLDRATVTDKAKLYRIDISDKTDMQIEDSVEFDALSSGGLDFAIKGQKGFVIHSNGKLTVINLSSMSVLVDSFDLSGNGVAGWYTCYIKGKFLYGGDGSGGGHITIVDIGDAHNPEFINRFSVPDSGHIGMTNSMCGIYVESKWLYVTGGSLSDSDACSLFIYDVSDKTSPVLKSTTPIKAQLTTLTDVWVRVDADTGESIAACITLGDGIAHDYLVLIDVTSKSSPDVLGELQIDGIVGSGLDHPCVVQIVRKRCYVAIGGNSFDDSGLDVIDIGNPDEPYRMHRANLGATSGSITGAGQKKMVARSKWIFLSHGANLYSFKKNGSVYDGLDGEPDSSGASNPDSSEGGEVTSASLESLEVQESFVSGDQSVDGDQFVGGDIHLGYFDDGSGIVYLFFTGQIDPPGVRWNGPLGIFEVSLDGTTWTDLGETSGSAGGDLSGTYPNPTVVAIQGTPVDSTPPSSAQVLTYSSMLSKWVAATLPSFITGVAIRKNNSAVGSRPAINFIEGTGVTITATDDGTGGEVEVTIAASAGGGLAGRGTVSYTTGSLADLAVETFLVTMGKSCILISVETDFPAWVRAYGSTAERTADAARPITTDPLPGTGVMADILTVTGGVPIKTAPPIIIESHESSPSSSVPISLQNRSGGTHVITVIFTYLVIEN